VKKQENVVLDIVICTREALFMAVVDTIHCKLSAAFAPAELSITDDSVRHEGHAGHRPCGETHFTVRIVSPAFAGLSRIERQRRVYAVLADELKVQIHALALTTLAPGE
jgi:BolA family transcriptional regulator, general stress-responsive regulator